MADISKIKLSNGNYVNVKDATARESLDNKQDKTDTSLQTTNKTIVGAINELKNSGGGVEVDNSTIKQDTKTKKIYATGNFTSIDDGVISYACTVKQSANTDFMICDGFNESIKFYSGGYLDCSYSSGIFNFYNITISGASFNTLSIAPLRTTFYGMKYDNDTTSSQMMIDIQTRTNSPAIYLYAWDGATVKKVVEFDATDGDFMYNNYKVATSADINACKKYSSSLLKNIYPVGSVYTTTSSDVLPDLGDTTITWEQIGSIEVNGVNIYFYRRTA